MTQFEYIRACDERFFQQLANVGKSLLEEKTRIICLSGPTCSGKTTAAEMLCTTLAHDGGRVHVISIDDFYFDRDYLHSISEDGKIDYDSERTIDIETLEEFVRNAMSGKAARCPVFDFGTGMRIGYKEFKPNASDIFIFEGIQAIYPAVTDLLSPYGTASVCICPMTDIKVGGYTFSPNRIRLMRRLVRDLNFRNTTPQRTLEIWKSVRENEDSSIFPYIEGCKYKINSTLEYEIGVLKPYLEASLPFVAGEDEATAKEILLSIECVDSIDSALIPENSLYKEFV